MMTVDGLPDDAIRMILEQSRTIAIVGASANPARASHRVMQALIDHGYVVHPVNPGQAGAKILGRTAYARLADVPGPVDIVDVFRAADAMPEVAAEAVAEQGRLNIRCLWMQLGLVNGAAASTAATAGMVVVMDRCTKIELSRLGIPKVAASG